MPSIKTAILATAILLFSTASSQDYNIDPSTIDLPTKETWCTTQQATCPLLCMQDKNGNSMTTEANDCDAPSLNFECICGNGVSPNASEYSQTIPFFKCQTYVQNCVNACGGQSGCQSACRVNNPCGAQDPERVNLSTVTTSLGAAATSAPTGVVYSGFGDQSSSGGQSKSGTTSAGMTAMDLGKSYGLAIVLTSVFAGLTLVL